MDERHEKDGRSAKVGGEEDSIPLDLLLASVASCRRCKTEIYADDDQARLCIPCHGRNRRWPVG